MGGFSIRIPTIKQVGGAIADVAKRAGPALGLINPAAPTVQGLYQSGQDIRDANLETQRAEDRAAGSLAQARQIQGRQQELANSFQRNLPSYTQKLQDSARRGIQTNLKQNVAGLRQNSASRGFLGGSANQGKIATAAGQAAIDTSNSDYNVQQALADEGQNLQNQALQSNLALSGANQQSQLDAFREALSRQQNNTDLWRALGQAGGTITGTYLGSRKGAT